nr:hypothetical protein [Tanacetum cinerariifolium]GEY66182.1 hypothetical protein [Tanacetum cinerariifolium]
MGVNEDGITANTIKLEHIVELNTQADVNVEFSSLETIVGRQSEGRSSFARAMIELRADVKLKDTIMVAMPKLVDECPRKIVSNVVKNLKTPKQAVKGVQVGPKVCFKPTKQVYRPVSNKVSDNISGKKKQAKLSSQEVSNSNPFDALNCVEDDDDDLAHTILDGKLTFVDDDGNPLYMNVPKGNEDSESEMKVVFDETANLMASMSLKGGSDSGYGTNSLFEQWRETK